MASDRKILNHTMISRNTSAFITLLYDTVKENPKPTAVGFKIVYVDKKSYPLSILEMSHIECE